MPYKDPKKQSAYQSAQMMGRRKAWLEENGPCRHCGTWENLEVDHINPAEKTSHRIWSWTKERRELELAKCQPLCSTCHKAKDHPLTHGKAYGGGCRCDLCREGHRKDIARWRAKRRDHSQALLPASRG